jgi:hypothetical protein
MPSEESVLVPHKLIVRGGEVIRTRKQAPGRTRCTVSLTDEHYKKLEEVAKKESTVFPRPVNELLSILIEKHISTLLA